MKKVRCVRCHGRKKIYKVGSGYTLAEMGGVKVDCPLCNAEGWIEPLVQVKADNQGQGPIIECDTVKLTGKVVIEESRGAEEFYKNEQPKKEKKK